MFVANFNSTIIFFTKPYSSLDLKIAQNQENFIPLKTSYQKFLFKEIIPLLIFNLYKFDIREKIISLINRKTPYAS